ncbi:carboxylesterase family protein [Streptomyces sp. NPDC051051]|uniref:carboxylesterase family protein n=1 Tax=Streptomyces sp. NPDC051051 TaxID=3155666 RepID=UPI0034303D86
MTATAPKAPTAPGVRSWWGIPYATAERYRRPVVADFDPDRPYDRKGVVSVQPDSGDWLEADSGMGEDCLNLNVWAPEQPADKALPVTVYIHGGGFEYGANTQITSNASGLAATGRVVGVSVNYRLAEASNLCLQDVIAALTWIKQNIAHFGGDPDNVTVYGHSGGAYATFGLPAARGALAHTAAGGNAHLLLIGPAEGAPAVHGTEMDALVGQEKPGRSPEQAERDTRIRDIVLDFATGEQVRLWPAVADRLTSGSVGNLPFEAGDHYQAALGLWENIDRP